MTDAEGFQARLVEALQRAADDVAEKAGEAASRPFYAALEGARVMTPAQALVTFCTLQDAFTDQPWT